MSSGSRVYVCDPNDVSARGAEALWSLGRCRSATDVWDGGFFRDVTDVSDTYVDRTSALGQATSWLRARAGGDDESQKAFDIEVVDLSPHLAVLHLAHRHSDDRALGPYCFSFVCCGHRLNSAAVHFDCRGEIYGPLVLVVLGLDSEPGHHTTCVRQMLSRESVTVN